MKITLIVLFLAGLTIYIKCITVLTLSPSHTASYTITLKRPSKPFRISRENEELNNLWEKKAGVSSLNRFKRKGFVDNIATAPIKDSNHVQKKISDSITVNNGSKQLKSAKLNEESYAWLAPLSVVDVVRKDGKGLPLNKAFLPFKQKGPALHTEHTPTPSKDYSRFLMPLNYLVTQCFTKHVNNCSQEYYRSLNANRSNEPSQMEHNMGYYHSSGLISNGDPDVIAMNPPHIQNIFNKNDALMLLSAKNTLMKFISRTLLQLSKPPHFKNVRYKTSSYPNIRLWQNLNISDYLELLPYERINFTNVTSNYDNEGWARLNYNDAFIPPRGRKHNSPNLDVLLQRYEPFVPNRGRRNKIEDIFKYDDLFYPHRGKRYEGKYIEDNEPSTLNSIATQMAANDLKNVMTQNQEQLQKAEWDGSTLEKILHRDKEKITYCHKCFILEKDKISKVKSTLNVHKYRQRPHSSYRIENKRSKYIRFDN